MTTTYTAASFGDLRIALFSTGHLMGLIMSHLKPRVSVIPGTLMVMVTSTDLLPV